MKVFAILILLFSTLACSQNVSSKLINENLDNFPIRESLEDKGKFQGQVYSVKNFISSDNNQKSSSSKIVEGKTVNLQDYTIYKKDGRRSFRETPTSVTKYYYDKDSDHLILREIQNKGEYGKSLNSSWLFYNKNQILSEEIGLKKDGNETTFGNYITYKIKDSSDQKKITITEIDEDSNKNPDKIYNFSSQNLMKFSPLYQSTNEKLSLLKGVFKVDEIDGYVFPERKVYFKYDKNGHVISEIWYNQESLEHKIEFSYNEDYTESTQTIYQQKGTEVASRKLSKFDKYGNLTFEQTSYYDGSIGGSFENEYQYDKEDNWIVKKIYYREENNGVLHKKKLMTVEYREIEYYKSDTKEESFELPKIPELIDKIRADIPNAAEKNQVEFNEKKQAIDNDSYDIKITKKQAENINDFTPKYWKLKASAYGNLDDDEADEAVTVYEMPSVNDGDTEQVLAIFRKENGKWKLWNQTSAPLLTSGSGGMMGNPFDGISISKKSITIKHFGGSREKWTYVHRYRFQNGDWYLIGASSNYGAPCDYDVKFDYNISTGDATYKKTKENCENGKIEVIDSLRTNQKIKPLKMNSNTVGDNVFKFSNLKDEINY